MTQLIQMNDASLKWGAIIKKNQTRIIRGAPNAQIGERLLSIAFNAVAYNEKIMACTPASVIGGIFETVKLGLTLGGPMQEAWLIPFKVKGLQTATLVIGYQGYRNLVDRSRSVLDLHPYAVHHDDFAKGAFSYQLGTDPKIVHRPGAEPVLTENQLYAAYAVGRLRGGGVQFVVMLKKEIDAHRARSRAKNNGPWVTDYVPMAMKTTIRSLIKYLPKVSDLMARAMELDDQSDRGVTQAFESDGFVDIETEPVIAKPAMEQLKANLEATPPPPTATPPASQGADPPSPDRLSLADQEDELLTADEVDWSGTPPSGE